MLICKQPLPFRYFVLKYTTIVAVVVLCAAPYSIGYLHSTEDHPFLGGIDYSEDIQSYFMWMRSSADHAGFIPNLYDPSEERPLFFHLLWWVLGKVVHYSTLPIGLIYHSAHFAGIVLFLLALWRFLQRVFPNLRQAGTAYIVCALGSGLGWYSLFFDPNLPRILRFKLSIPNISLDLWCADVNVFYSLLTCPHVAVSLWLLIEIMDRMQLNLYIGHVLCWAMGLAFTAALGFIHVYDVFTVVLLSWVYAWVRWRFPGSEASLLAKDPSRTVLYLGGWTAAGALAVAFYLWAVFQSHGIASWADQNRLPAYHPLLYLQAWGLPAVLAVTYWKGWQRFRQGDATIQFLFCWLACGLILLYSYPLLPFARRVAEGLQIPIVCLGVFSLYDQWIPWCKRVFHPSRRDGLCLTAIAMLTVFPVTGFLVWNTALAASSEAHPFFLAEGVKEALDYLNCRADKNGTILCRYHAGNILPRFTGMRVYVGHGHITPDRHEKDAELQIFFSGQMPPEEMYCMLQYNRIGYVWVSDRDFSNADRVLRGNPSFALCFQNEKVRIYRVMECKAF